MNAPFDTASAGRSLLARSSDRPLPLKVVDDVPSDLANCADEHGSLVTVEPVDWIICFVPGLKRQWWHRFVHHKHKHVFAMRPTNTGSWLLVEPWWTRMMVTILPPADAVKFLRWGGTGDILRVREQVPGRASQMRGWSNCAVITAFVLGRPSWTWTPHGLYKELLREKTTRRENVEQLLVDQFAKVVSQYSSNALSVSADQLSLPLRELLVIIGRNLLETMMTPALLEVCYTAILEADRYPNATRVYAQHGPKRAIEVLTNILARAKQAGEIDLADCEAGARQFLGMLYGNIHLEAVLQLGAIPTLSEIDLRARTAVKVFLDGAGPDETAILERAVLRNGGGSLPVAGRRAWVYLR
ncbi:TetR/AcrR family transcriptional regulator C-terminal domain-containing protein [Bradyrhizobium sp. AUGA SZCCT0240]|nr:MULTISPECIES: TetR/AcrR family transcriptional regulator C-terminal domain-containing protein [unclassified Bradyrhizobium]MBR1198438.1 TetR/AcrR family transcriptional regulator C-terminal domain-containing protein [Bradyrhizobium sp. AUGA SZCCT0158]MBR1243121.1 TetR/AcrR family transcriptional regulator C-terminal domain-containing protein [Bradyrhizobium sp. AUGA SZCCT0274]MBR1253747.1 TetR/AcrR family transcriptional regulator C-terminal domain-containing protein [Bradyrhizobium sp. AUGA 